MSYMALYRKWRPDAFEEIKGQEHIVTTIRNQIVHDRVGHAYLFLLRSLITSVHSVSSGWSPDCLVQR